jgi:hypothetical protein
MKPGNKNDMLIRVQKKHTIIRVTYSKSYGNASQLTL